MKYFLSLTLICLVMSCNSNSTDSDANNSTNDSIQNPSENTTPNRTKSDAGRDYQELYPDGTVKIEGNYDENQKRHGLWISYYDNGIKWSETLYSSGKKHGHSITFFPNGKVRYVGEYRADEKTGEWTFYDELGNVVSTETY